MALDGNGTSPDDGRLAAVLDPEMAALKAPSSWL